METKLKYLAVLIQVAFRGDAAFAKPEVYEASEERGVQYAMVLGKTWTRGFS